MSCSSADNSQTNPSRVGTHSRCSTAPFHLSTIVRLPGVGQRVACLACGPALSVGVPHARQRNHRVPRHRDWRRVLRRRLHSDLARLADWRTRKIPVFLIVLIHRHRAAMCTANRRAAAIADRAPILRTANGSSRPVGPHTRQPDGLATSPNDRRRCPITGETTPRSGRCLGTRPPRRTRQADPHRLVTKDGIGQSRSRWPRCLGTRNP